MQVRQLQAFKAVLELGSATRAAGALGISQPAISKSLANLSAECGFELFIRNRNGLEPTAEALSLFREVERLFTSVNHIERHAAAIRDMRSGLISIAAFPAVATRPLPVFLYRFTQKYPDIRVSLAAKSGRFLIEHVGADQVDFGIGLLMLEHPGVNFESLGTIPVVCVMNPNHHLAKKRIIRAEDLDNEAFISLGSEDQARYKIDGAFEGTKIRRRIIMEAHQSEAACSFAAQGAGIALVEPFSANGFRTDELHIVPFRPAINFELWLMTPANRPRSRLANLLIDEFRRFAGSFREISARKYGTMRL